MNRSFKATLLTIGLAGSLIGAGNALAQGAGGSSNAPTGGGDSGTGNGGGGRGRGNFDRAAMQQQMLDHVKERLEVTDDGEWKVISGLVTKVMDARMEERRAAISGMMGGGRRGEGGRGESGGRGEGGGRGGFNSTPTPEADDLQKSLDAKASPEEIKAKLAKFRESRKDKEATLAKVQENLRTVLTLRQEAEATMIGLLP